MKRRFMIYLLFLIIPILLVTGSASWIIVGEKTVNLGSNSVSTPVAYILDTPDVKYTRIEKALDVAENGDIVVVIPPTAANYHETSNKVVPDKVTYYITSDCEIKSGVSLVIPTDTTTFSSVTNSTTLDSYIKSLYTDDRSRGTSSYSKIAAEAQYLRITIEVADGVTIKNNGKLVVSGYLSSGTGNAGMNGQTSHSYSRILLGNNSKIIQDNSSAITYCFGYINEKNEDNGSQFVAKQGKVYVPFIVADYRGFSFSWSMTDGAIDIHGCSAFNQFEFINISSTAIFNYSSTVYGITNTYVSYSSMSISKVFTNVLTIVGSTSSAFIQFNNSSYSYLEYKYSKTNLNSKVKLHGGCVINDFQLKLKEATITVDLSTTNAYFPLSYKYNVELCTSEGQSTAEYDITQQRIKLLPGASLTVNSGCTLKATSIIVYSAFYDGSNGNGRYSINAYNGVKYPFKEGAILRVENGGNINCSSLAGTVYANTSSIAASTTTITSNEAWSFESSGGYNPAWTINEYLEIREKLNIVPIPYLYRDKIYVGVNTFKNYNSYLPAMKIHLNDSTETIDINQYQYVVHLSDITNYSFEFVSNIYKAYYGSTYYNKNSIISYSDSNKIIGMVNSSLSILNNNSSGVNEFNAQKVDITCTTPTVDGVIPLYVDTTIKLEATVTDIDKVYNKPITWKSLDESIATVDSSGNVTGVSVGEVIIQAICDGVVGEYTANVLEEIDIAAIESIEIEDESGNVGSNSKEYGLNTEITFTVNINPVGTPYSSITWKLKASAAGRQYINDENATTNKETNVNYAYNTESINVYFTADTGKDADTGTITCTILDLKGNTLEATFTFTQKASVCVAAGTLITMADGSQKAVENIVPGDKVLTFNHETGKYNIQPVVFNSHSDVEWKNYDIINLEFDDGTLLKVINEHTLFDSNLNKYIVINKESMSDYIGHTFYGGNYDGSRYIRKDITLINAYITNEYTGIYNPLTYYDMNCFTEGLLTMPGDISSVINIFDYDDNLQYNQESMTNAIEKYGLYTYDDFKDYYSYEVYCSLPFPYLKILVGRKEISFEDIISLVDYHMIINGVNPRS